MLGSYGIKTGSKIMMLGDRIAKFPGGSPYGNTSPTFASSHSTAAAGSPRSVAKSKEEQQLDLLEGYEEHVRRELVPKLDHLKAELQRPASVFKDVSYLSREVGELLLQTQLKVDSVVSDNEVNFILCPFQSRALAPSLLTLFHLIDCASKEEASHQIHSRTGRCFGFPKTCHYQEKVYIITPRLYLMLA